MLDKTAIRNNKKFLVSCHDPYMANIFIEECQVAYGDYKTKLCFDTQEFVEEINRGNLFSSDKKIIALMELSEANINDVDPYLDCDTDDVIILIEKSAISKNKAYTKIKTNYSYQKLDKMSDRDCRSWLHTHMTREGLRFKPEIPAFIINIRGTDLYALVNEVKKLKYLNKDITENLCTEVICESSESNFYEFIDHFTHKRVVQCLTEFEKVDPTKYIQLLHFMIGKIEKLYKIVILREQKKTAEEISDLIGIPKFIIQTKFYTAITIFNKVKLLKTLDFLNDLDIQLRVSRLRNKLIFESYLLKIFKM